MKASIWYYAGMSQSTLLVLVNREGGRAAKAGDDLFGTLTSAFAKSGGADIQMLTSHEMPAAIANTAKSHRRIAVAGGDGTMSCAAQGLAGSETELAILPLGTLNHLARDLAIPTNLDAAAALAVHGKSVKIDLGTVNGHCFVNNASMGLYPVMVKERDAVTKHAHWPKWLATVPAAWDALAHFPTLHLHVNLGDGEFPLRTRLLFVGNNRYVLEGANIGSRPSLQAGQLWTVAVARRSRLGLAVGALRTLVGRAGMNGDFKVLGESATFTVTNGEVSLEIALDGEVLQLNSPLKFESRAAALRVVVPDRLPGTQASGPSVRF
jgi:diacylglycerol kinase family enzyme